MLGMVLHIQYIINVQTNNTICEVIYMKVPLFATDTRHSSNAVIKLDEYTILSWE